MPEYCWKADRFFVASDLCLPRTYTIYIDCSYLKASLYPYAFVSYVDELVPNARKPGTCPDTPSVICIKWSLS